jgi:prevent-host-death family protein
MGTKQKSTVERVSTKRGARFIKHEETTKRAHDVPVERGERVLSTAEARTHLSETLGLVAYSGERVVIGKRGRPMAALVPIADLQALRALEDSLDLEAARKSRRDTGENLSHMEVGKRLGLR